MGDLLTVKQAKERLLPFFSVLQREIIPLREGLGRILAQDIAAGIDLPLFTNSSMDGFAVVAEDVSGASPVSPVHLRVVEDIPAGKSVVGRIEHGQAARVMTGAPLPSGADCVVPVEFTNLQSWTAGQALTSEVRVLAPVKPGDYIRPVGQDVQKGQIVLTSGHRLRPQDIGFLSMLGLSDAPVIRKARVAVFSTGDELLETGSSPLPGKIYDSNRATLLSLLAQAGVDGLDLGIAADNEDNVKRLLDQAVSSDVDIILTTAGVSVGAFDFVRKVVEQAGEMQFWRVNMRPGKPFAFGKYQSIPFFGLPGNPVSAFVSYEVFVRPILRLIEGDPFTERAWLVGRLMDAVESDGRESYLRCIATQSDNGWELRLAGHQGSGNLFSLVQANALLFIPSGVKSLPIDTEIKFWMLD